MTTLLIVIHVLSCITLILLVLLQAGRGADMGAAFGGASTPMFGSGSATNPLARMTTITAVAFLTSALFLAVVSARRASVFDDTPEPFTATPQAESSSPPPAMPASPDAQAPAGDAPTPSGEAQPLTIPATPTGEAQPLTIPAAPSAGSAEAPPAAPPAAAPSDAAPPPAAAPAAPAGDGAPAANPQGQ